MQTVWKIEKGYEKIKLLAISPSLENVIINVLVYFLPVIFLCASKVFKIKYCRRLREPAGASADKTAAVDCP